VNDPTTPAPSRSDQRLALNPAEAADALGLSRNTIYRLIYRGELRARKAGTRVLIPRKSLEEYLEQSTP
jgi:excisionase family DNA binding protein